MTNKCEERFESIVAHIMGELDLHAASDLEEHITGCAMCRETRNALLEEEKEVRSGFEALSRSFGSASQVLLQERQTPTTALVGLRNNHFHERVKSMILAHKRLSVAAATVTTLAVSLILYVVLFSTSTEAYALEQTAQANKQITSFHVKITPAAELGEAWIEVNPDGTPRRARMDLKSPDDGDKVIILSGEEAEVWFKAKKTRLLTTAKNALKDLMAKRNIFDPKFAFEQLQAQQKAGEVQVVTKPPAKKGDPITLTVMSKDMPDRRAVYDVDPDSKLVKRVTEFRRRDDQWQQVELRTYLDYNQPIDPTVFQLDVPKDVITVDQLNRKIGLAKGDLSDNEIATRLAKEFVEAAIAEDFQKAGAIYGGIPAEELKRRFEKARIKFLRLIEIGKPTPNAKTRSLLVPVEVEVEVDGKKMIIEISPSSRAVEGQPDRWQIIGGI